MSVYMYANTSIYARVWVYIYTRVGAFCLFVLFNLSTTCACTHTRAHARTHTHTHTCITGTNLLKSHSPAAKVVEASLSDTIPSVSFCDTLIFKFKQIYF